MISRAEIVDILTSRNVPEAKAWEIAIGVEPACLEAMGKISLWR